jgi:uncharacterized protein YbaR (Trm112 family)
MHLLLTDRLTCPRCGPEFGLILLADRLEERRILEGFLGCPNCRERYPVEGGFGDLRAPPRGELPPVPPHLSVPDPDDTTRIAALLGVPRGPGHVLLVGGLARHAPSLARAVEDLEVIAVDPDLRAWTEQAGVSRIAVAPGLPFFRGALRGAALDGGCEPAFLREAGRVVAPFARVVVDGARDATAKGLEEMGFEILLVEGSTVVGRKR